MTHRTPAAPGASEVDVGVDLHVDLGGDHHVHSTFSDDASSTLQENLEAAAAAGLHTLCATDHVRGSTTWVPEFLAAVSGLTPMSGTGGTPVSVLAGVETKILDATGRLDLPDRLPFRSSPGGIGLDRVLIADHQFPGPDGPWSPAVAREKLQNGWAAADLVDLLVTATIRAIASVPAAQLAHPFSILPKIGLSEDDLGQDHLRSLGGAAAAAGCPIEINEKWSCPGPRAARALAGAGALLVASTDSHTHRDVGQYDVVRTIIGSIP